MIELTQGDILKAKTEALVNTVNCVGVMGRGIALQFKKAYPGNFNAYRSACNAKEVKPGKMFVYDLNRIYNPRYIINFPTKRHWKEKSKIEYIQSGLDALVEEMTRLRITSIAIPPLGCGLGGLNWDSVRELIIKKFQTLPQIDVLLFEPAGAPQPSEMAKGQKVPNMTAGRAALLSLMNRYLAAAMDPTITLLEVHKLMYFMQEAGETLRLNYEKAPYGPYANNLRHVLNHIEGHFIEGYGDAEDNPGKQLQLKPQAVKAAAEFLKDRVETRERLDFVFNLIQGLETPYGMELLATLHWIAVKEGTQDLKDATKKFYAWGSQKEMFKSQHIELTWKRLEAMECIPNSQDSQP